MRDKRKSEGAEQVRSGCVVKRRVVRVSNGKNIHKNKASFFLHFLGACSHRICESNKVIL